MARPNLVVVRASDTSLHPRWLASKQAGERNWDLIVNYFGDDPEKWQGGDWVRIASKSRKLPALHDLFLEHEHIIRKYEYVWCPDDDLDCSCEEISRMFAICHEYSLDMAQPSLTPNSYFTYQSTLHNAPFRLRYMYFVEMMAPCFSRETLWELLPTFAEKDNLSGWGVDHVWAQLVRRRQGRAAVIDAAQIWHTRPLGGANYNVFQGTGKTAWDELNAILSKYGISRRHQYKMHGAVTRQGRSLAAGPWLTALYGMGLLLAAPRLKTNWRQLPGVLLRGLWQQR